MSVYLRILQGPNAGNAIHVADGEPITFGRSSASTYAFDDPLLSRKHCAVEARGDLCRVVDLQSRNGTFVNGQRVGAVVLNLGDRIKIGGLLFEVSNASPSSASQPATPGPGQAGIGHCEACGEPINGQGEELHGRILCLGCFDRFDVDEDMVEGFRLFERREVTSFGTTYRAQQLLMDRPVLLKTIEVGPETDPKVLRRLMREAKTGGRLTHPHIVELYDVNEQGGMFYIVTEYVEGETLGVHLRKAHGPLPGMETLRVMAEVCDALAYAHERQIVHRDVRPGNVIVRSADGAAKLQGFTLAKNLERANLSIITADGESIGTPYYMAPEQIKSARDVDVRCDVYSWGATLYHCVAGKLPLEARSYGDFIDKVFATEPPPLDSHVRAPAALVDLLARCLRRSPAERPATMRAVQGELKAIWQAIAPS